MAKKQLRVDSRTSHKAIENLHEKGYLIEMPGRDLGLPLSLPCINSTGLTGIFFPCWPGYSLEAEHNTPQFFGVGPREGAGTLD